MKAAVGFSRRAALAAALSASAAHAMGRIPYGGRLRLAVPWPISALDPAALSDGFSALFASAVFEPLYALDASGTPYAALAQALPVKHGDTTTVTLRPGLKAASGKPLAAADLVETLTRARVRAGAGLLGELPTGVAARSDPLSASFASTTPEQLARMLASPLTALVPRGFSPVAPDGTGAFSVELRPGRALLTRNPNAPRGGAFLEAIEVSSAPDLAELLRGFEAGTSDVGWFGSGLYRAVRDAVPFEAPSYAFAVLVGGRTAGPWGAPGALQALLDGVDPNQLKHLGLKALPNVRGQTLRWGGPPSPIVVLRDAPQLVAIAQALAVSLSALGHELSVVEKSAEELHALRDSRQFVLMVDVVRAPGTHARELELVLRTAASPEAARRAPKSTKTTPRELGRTLPLGVIGELAVFGAHRSGFHGVEQFQLGAVWHR